jgi:hypothetical protein
MTENEKKRPQFFYEIGKGKLAREAQAMYESIQQLALESKQPITMTLKISVQPPPEDDRFGRTYYTLTHNQPTSKSIQFATEYEGGVAVRSGESIEALLQMDIFPSAVPESERV